MSFTPKAVSPNTLYYGDNLEVLRRHVDDESVDLIYLDPPFNSNADYNVLFAEKDGTQAHAQITAFEDTWTWDLEAAAEYAEVLRSGHDRVAKCLKGMHDFLGGSDMMAYLSMMALRLIELRRVLKPTGSLYLHCDPTASHYLKLLLDAVMGPENFLSEAIWKRTSAHNSAKRFGPVHDTILLYARSDSYLWTSPLVPHDPEYVEEFFRSIDPETGRKYHANVLTGAGVRHGDSGKPWRGYDPTSRGRHWALPSKFLEQLGITSGTVQEKLDALDAGGRVYWPEKQGGSPRAKYYADELTGQAIPDVWTDIPPISGKTQEKLGYPTQKPEALLERVIAASSREGDVVLDPFCGCGTAIAAAQKLKRRWIGIDITHLAINLIKVRLADSFGSKIVDEYRVVGEPRDLESARTLAADKDRYQFQYWALGLVGARPQAQDQKKGADKGIDGRLYMTDASGDSKSVVISVKSGGVTVSQIRDLIGVTNNEDAAIGVFICIEVPTAPMRKAAADAGMFQTKSVAGSTHPRLQILTIEELLAGKKIDMPAQQDIRSFKQAPKAKPKKKAEEAKLF